MSCPYEKSAVAYARFSHEAMNLLLEVYDHYVQLAAENAVVPPPTLDPVIKSFIEFYRTTLIAHPVLPE